MGTIGEILGDARQDSGLSIDDVAYETHIQPATIRSIEEDDFSIFPSVAYAKSFIRKYAEFLEVDVSSALEALNSGVTVRLGDNELMDEMKRTIKKDRRFRLEKRPKAVRRKLDKPGSTPILLNLILIALIAALAVFYFFGFNTNNVEEAKQEITKGLQKANPFADESEIESSGMSDDSAVLASVDSTETPGEKTVPGRATVSQPRLQAVDLSKPQAITAPDPGTTPSIVENGTTFFGPADLSEITSTLGTPTDSIAKPKTFDQGVEIKKPEVDWSVEKPRPRPLAEATSVGPESEAPAVRTTPAVKIEVESSTPAVPSIRSEELPALQRAREEPNAVLRPEGTNPRTPEEEAAEQNSGRTEPATTEADAGENDNVARAQ